MIVYFVQSTAHERGIHGLRDLVHLGLVRAVHRHRAGLSRPGGEAVQEVVRGDDEVRLRRRHRQRGLLRHPAVRARRGQHGVRHPVRGRAHRVLPAAVGSQDIKERTPHPGRFHIQKNPREADFSDLLS